MSKRPAWTAGLLALALAGCGSGGQAATTTGHQTLRIIGAKETSVPMLCALLRARLEGIEHTAAMNDPQPAALTGRLPAERVERASSEAIGIGREVASDLRAKHASAESLHALNAAGRGYRHLARRLHGKSARRPAAGLRMQTAFQRIAALELSDCAPGPGG